MNLRITVDQVILIHREFVCDAPLRDPGGLAAAVAAPFQEFTDFVPYPTLAHRGAKLVEGLSRAQAFADGNKRTAWLSMLALLEVNGQTLRTVDPGEAADWVLTLRGDEAGLIEGALWLNERMRGH